MSAAAPLSPAIATRAAAKANVKPIVTATASALAVLAVALPPPVAAQPANAALEARPVVQTMRQDVYRDVREARRCLRDGDLDCSEAVIEQLFLRQDLNSYERAQAWNARAALDFRRGDTIGAIEAYERMLAEPRAPEGLVRSAHYALAQLRLGQSDADAALQSIDRWWAMATPSAPEPFVLRARIQLERRDYAASLDAIERALALAAERGREPVEDWHKIHYASLWSLGRHEPASTVLREMLDRWPQYEYYAQLARIYATLDDPAAQREIYETAYSSGWLESGVELLTLASLRIEAEDLRAGLNVLQQNRARGSLGDGEAVRALIARARDWVAGEAVDAVERETLIRNALLEERLRTEPRRLRL